LKITIQGEAYAVTLKIEGKVVGAFVREFRRAWDELAPSLKSRKVIVDLRETTFLNAEGKQVLAEIAKTGAEFLFASPLTRYYAEEATGRIPTNGNS
jgi:anti-anti-sigma regulatory factor